MNTIDPFFLFVSCPVGAPCSFLGVRYVRWQRVHIILCFIRYHMLSPCPCLQYYRTHPMMFARLTTCHVRNHSLFYASVGARSQIHWHLGLHYSTWSESCLFLCICMRHDLANAPLRFLIPVVRFAVPPHDRNAAGSKTTRARVSIVTVNK